MALDVPKSPKINTTKYQNFRGVDYTNDPSNVWYRRSPNGLNMLPGLDGNPFKRNGWKVELSAQDFIQASGVVGVTEVEQYKVDYFELNGAEWLCFYTSVGLFFYSDELIYVDTYVPWIRGYRTLTKTYDVGDVCWRSVNHGVPTYFRCTTAVTVPEAYDGTHWEQLAEKPDLTESFPPTSEGADAAIDYTKSFFFEGGGDAGYYLFVGTTMFVFDGTQVTYDGVDTYVIKEVEPKIPTVLIGCSPNGAGTESEAVNMLTQYRTIQFAGDGVTTTFTIPGGFEKTEISGNDYGTGIWNVYTLQGGVWTVTTTWSCGVNDGEIEFSPAPPDGGGIDTVRVTYRPAGMNATEKTVITPSQGLSVSKTTTYRHTQEKQKVNGKWKWVDVTSAADKSTPYAISYKNVTSPKFDISNPKKPLYTYVRRDLKSGGVWQTDASTVARTFNSYGSQVTLSGANDGKTTFNNWTAKEEKTTWSDYGKEYTYNGATRRRRFDRTKSVKTYPVRVNYTSLTFSSTNSTAARSAFFATSRSLVFGNGIINQIFLTASASEKYSTRVWYSMATDPTYFPDTNYIEVGATDKKIMGLIKVGEYLGVVKQGSGKDTSIYLAYPTSFEDVTTYAVKQSVNGVGAISNGAFNILNDEPLFLSPEGVMGIEPAEDDARKIRNRSYYINKPLLAEPSLDSAVSFVFKGMYWLCVNDHCYVLDGSQKNSWENTKTNLQYEAYYLDNIPAKCFAKKDDRLWFIDNHGNACRFRADNDELRFVDAYDADAINDNSVVIYKAYASPVDGVIMLNSIGELHSIWEYEIEPETPIDMETVSDWYRNGHTINIESENVILDVLHLTQVALLSDYTYGSKVINSYTYTQGEGTGGTITVNKYQTILTPIGYPHPITSNFRGITTIVVPASEVPVGSIIQVDSDQTKFYTVTESRDDSVSVVEGCPIKAVWSTIADDDGSAHYYKKLQKKGSVVVLMPMSDSGVKVWLNPDGRLEEDWIFVGETDAKQTILPFNYYMKKKLKRYKRLQIVCENATYNDGFGIDEIIKSYTIGNYAKR